MMEEIIMKLAVIYHSETENTKQAAEWIADGMNEVSGVEARAFSIEKVDEDFVKEAKGIVVGSPSYMAQMTPQIHNWLFEKAGELEFPGKMGGAFATEQYTHGGGTQVIQSILTIEMVKGMLCYSGGMACGKPVIHLGPVGVNNNMEKFNGMGNYKEYFNIYGNTRDVIITFGAQEEIFSYDVVSTDVLEVLAKEFYYAYQKIMIDAMPETNEKEIEEKKKAKESLKQTAEEEWNARREALQDKHSLNAQIKLAYQEEQDRANVWHIDTKKFLAGAMGEDGKDNKERLKEMVELTQRDAHTLNYSKVCDVVSSTLFDNLSKCEHLRWNACMELQGFVTCDGDKDFQQKKHKCIVDNDILRSKYPETIPYDQCVVELSFRLKKN